MLDGIRSEWWAPSDQNTWTASLGNPHGYQRPPGQVPLPPRWPALLRRVPGTGGTRFETLSKPGALPEGWPPTRPTASRTMAIAAAVATPDERSEHFGSASDDPHRHQHLPLQAATEAEGAEAGGDHRPGGGIAKGSRRPGPLGDGGPAAAEVREQIPPVPARLVGTGRRQSSTTPPASVDHIPANNDRKSAITSRIVRPVIDGRTAPPSKSVILTAKEKPPRWAPADSLKRQ